MIKCQECGFVTNRLQWTHFKYKCSGSAKNIKDYLLLHPGAKLVSEELSKNTAVTLENLIKKYGNIEGQNRWANYKSKQATSNTFEYKKEKYGWTEEQFKEYNRSRAVTLEKMIEKYGEENGTIMWETYCERQAFTNTKKYFQEKYGEVTGSLKYFDINKTMKSNCFLISSRIEYRIPERELIMSNTSC